MEIENNCWECLTFRFAKRRVVRGGKNKDFGASSIHNYKQIYNEHEFECTLSVVFADADESIKYVTSIRSIPYQFNFILNYSTQIVQIVGKINWI